MEFLLGFLTGVVLVVSGVVFVYFRYKRNQKKDFDINAMSTDPEKGKGAVTPDQGF